MSQYVLKFSFLFGSFLLALKDVILSRECILYLTKYKHYYKTAVRKYETEKITTELATKRETLKYVAFLQYMHNKLGN